MSVSSAMGVVSSAKVKTAAGGDVFRLVEMRYTETVATPFTMVLDLVSDQTDLDPDSLLGTPATVSFALPGGGQRHFSGLVAAVEQRTDKGEIHAYRLVVRPWIALLELGSDCRIFQNKKPADIFKLVFDDLGFSDYSLSGLVGNYPELPFCLQYDESHLAFVERLMQRFGISYHTEQSDGSHKLVFTDDPSSHKPFPGYDTIPFRAAADASRAKEHIESWAWRKQVAPGKQVLKDYDYINPKSKLEATKTAPHSYTHGDLERFEYPGFYTKQSDGDTLAQIRVDEATCAEYVVTGTARCWGLAAGSIFTLGDFPRKDQNKPWLTTAVEIVVSTAKGAEQRSRGYSCLATFTAIPADVKYRPARTTPVPRIAGHQTAVVVGPAGQDPKSPYTDEYGNIRVQFRWDRQGQNNEKSSCWIRYQQFAAGPQWGAVFVPRLGCEVAVVFEGGDPDRPLAIGSLYNADNKPPTSLPGEAKTFAIQDDGGNYLKLTPDDGNQVVTIYSTTDTTKLKIGKT
jgi:type VI secretion system secreted protein VgrG